MRFVLFRHAHKGLLPFEDPELSLPGFEQAVRLPGLLKSPPDTALPRPTRLMVSPRRRASQTFYPLAKELQLPLTVQAELDQRQNTESGAEFRRRVQEYLQRLPRESAPHEVIFACTHYDWIEEAMNLINCDRDLNSFEFSHWSPTQYAAFDAGAEPWKFLQKGTAK